MSHSKKAKSGFFIALASQFRRDKTSHAGKFKAERFKRFGRFCEAMVVLSLTLPVCVIYAAYRLSSGQIPALLLTGTIALFMLSLVVFFIFAVRCRHAFNNFSRVSEARAQHAASLAADKKFYMINDLRLRTLKAAKVPVDVLECLRALRQEELNRSVNSDVERKSDEVVIVGETDFINRLEKKLGRQRIGEYKEVILKYASS